LAARYLLGFVGKQRNNKKLFQCREASIFKYHGTIPQIENRSLFDLCSPSTAEQSVIPLKDNLL
jgi:hypothetical protein